MKHETINIYADKKFAFVFFVSFAFVSVYFSIDVWFESMGFFKKVLVSSSALAFETICLFGIFTLFSKRFKYYGPGTPEYIAKPDEAQIFSICADKIQVRINPKKYIHFSNITSVSVLANKWDQDFDDDMTTTILIESTSGEKFWLREWGEQHDFLMSFQLYQKLPVGNTPSNEDFIKQFGEMRLWLFPLIGRANALKIKIWPLSDRTPEKKMTSH